MIMDDRWFSDRSDSVSQEEKRLHDRLYEFGDYFLDMLFEEGSSVHELIRCQVRQNDGTWQDDVFCRPEELECFSYNFFETKVESLGGEYKGYFNEKEQTLCISPENLESDSVILHEMIHLHEFVLNGLPLFYHDTLLWALYRDLKLKIRDLDEAISCHAHILNEQSIYNIGGLHDILFLLKSLDLDIKMRYQLGTIFGYDAIVLFKKFTYKKDI